MNIRLLFAVCIASGAMLSLWFFSVFSGPRTSLPLCATEIREFSQVSDNLNADYFYLLKAKIPEDEFPAYVQRLGLVLCEDRKDHQRRRHSWSNDREFPHEWWNPSPATDKTYVLPAPHSSRLIMAKHEFGYVFFFQSSGI